LDFFFLIQNFTTKNNPEKIHPDLLYEKVILTSWQTIIIQPINSIRRNKRTEGIHFAQLLKITCWNGPRGEELSSSILTHKSHSDACFYGSTGLYRKPTL